MKKYLLLPLALCIVVFNIIAVGQFVFPRLLGIPPVMTGLNELPLQAYRSLLVVAPHNDDEVIGAGGLIIQALQNDIPVHVVIETNGDGYALAALNETRRVPVRPYDYVSMGNKRQNETLEALSILGVPAENVIFLGYPDRGTPSLWMSHWGDEEHYLSPFTRQAYSPYLNTYNPEAVYTGNNLLDDIYSVISTLQPDLIIVSHTSDTHPDHWSLSLFTQLATALARLNNSTYSPQVYTYLVHYPDFPNPRGWKIDAGINPPPLLYKLNPEWYRIDLDDEMRDLKWLAMGCYRSQMPLLKELLQSFIRKNELFELVEDHFMPVIAQGEWDDPESWQNSDGQPIDPVAEDPVGDSPSKNLFSQADLTAVYVGQLPGGDYAQCMQMKGNASGRFTYQFQNKAVGAEGVTNLVQSSKSSGAMHLRGQYVCQKLRAAELAGMSLFYVGAITRGPGGLVIDRAPWKLILMPSEENVLSSLEMW